MSDAIKIKFKKLHPDAVIPKFETEGAAAMDLTAVSVKLCKAPPFGTYIDHVVCDIGLAIEIPKGYVGLLASRSSIFKTDLILANGIGIIDSDFRGSIKAIFKNITNEPDKGYLKGDRVAQLMIIKLPEIEIEEATELSNTDRGEGGFGSTGR